MSAYLEGLLRYFDIAGRSTRSQYWLYYLFSTTIIIAAICCDVFLLRVRPSADLSTIMPVTLAVSIFHMAPSFTVTIRRLHDVGRSGWWYLIQLVPFGALLILYWSVCPSEEGENEYGPQATRSYRRGNDSQAYGRRPRSADYVRQTIDRVEAKRPQTERFI